MRSGMVLRHDEQGGGAHRIADLSMAVGAVGRRRLLWMRCEGHRVLTMCAKLLYESHKNAG